MVINEFDIEKAKASILYITENIGETDLLKIFKILYFAERKHLAKYGSPILADRYIAMKNGPVPSLIYDFFKGIRGDGFKYAEAQSFYNAFTIKDRYIVTGKEKPNLDYLSKSNIGCIEDAIRDNHDLSFGQLSDKSHDSAWKNAYQDDAMDFIEIAKAGGANEEMVKYISNIFENNRLEIE